MPLFLKVLFSLNARPHKRQRFNHHRVEIKAIVLHRIALHCILEAQAVFRTEHK